MTAATTIWLAILGVSLTTLLTRGSFVAFAARLQLPPLVEAALRFAPAAVLGALVLPALVLRQGHVDVTLTNPRLMAGLFAAIVMWRSRSMIAAIIAGVGLATLLRLYA